MKKTYISPVVKVKQIAYELMEETPTASITNIGGNSGLEMGKDETPTEADAKVNYHYNVWDEEF